MSQDCFKSTAGGLSKAPVQVPKKKKIINEEEELEDEEPEPAPVVVKGKKAPTKAPAKGAKK